MLRNVGILTSGGDNAGLNAVIRAAVRTGITRNVTVFGVHRGYRGLVEGQIFPLTSRNVAGTLGEGGTWLGTARLPEWREKKVRREAIRNMNRLDIQGLIVIGGNGSLSGAYNLHKDGFPVIGIPGSIDDDVNGTDICLGVDTALNVIIEAIDKIRDCASSIQRAFVVEVMGRDCGALALMASAATGAELCLIPEIDPPPMERIAEVLFNAYTKGKSHAICIVAEGCKTKASEIVKFLQDHQDETGFDVRPTVLGYTQRGGSPTYRDRFYGTRMGVEALKSLIDGNSGQMIAVKDGKITQVPLEEVVNKLKPISQELLGLYQDLDV